MPGARAEHHCHGLLGFGMKNSAASLHCTPLGLPVIRHGPLQQPAGDCRSREHLGRKAVTICKVDLQIHLYASNRSLLLGLSYRSTSAMAADGFAGTQQRKCNDDDYI